MQNRKAKLLAHALTLVVVCSAGATGLAAQQPGPGKGAFAISVVPRLGLFSPDRYLYEEYVNFSGDGPVEWTHGRMGRALLVGMGLEAGRTGGGVSLRGELLRSIDGWLAAAHSVIIPRQLYEAPYVQTTWLDIPVAVTITSLQVHLPTRLTFGGVEPYVLAGIGSRRYDFGDATAEDPGAVILPESGSILCADAGAGITARVLGLTIDLQGRDAIGRYWGKTQHDILFTAGLAWRIR